MRWIRWKIRLMDSRDMLCLPLALTLYADRPCVDHELYLHGYRDLLHDAFRSLCVPTPMMQ